MHAVNYSYAIMGSYITRRTRKVANRMGADQKAWQGTRTILFTTKIEVSYRVPAASGVSEQNSEWLAHNDKQSPLSVIFSDQLHVAHRINRVPSILTVISCCSDRPSSPLSQ